MEVEEGATHNIKDGTNGGVMTIITIYRFWGDIVGEEDSRIDAMRVSINDWSIL
jgi:hypothetical protein